MLNLRQSKPLGWFLIMMAGIFMIAISILLFLLPLRGALAGAIQGGGSFLMFVIGIKLIVIGRKKKAISAEEAVEKDTRPPIIYLRPFILDEVARKRAGFQALKASYEEKIAKAVRSLGPFVCVGRPNERTPELGAARMYLDDETWKEEVTKLIKKASLVLLHIGEGKGILWEFQLVLNVVKPQRLILCVAPSFIQDQLKSTCNQPEYGSYESFYKMTSELFPVPLPKEVRNALFICFDNKWNPTLIEPAKSFDAKSLVNNPKTKIGKFQISALEGLNEEFS